MLKRGAFEGTTHEGGFHVRFGIEARCGNKLNKGVFTFKEEDALAFNKGEGVFAFKGVFVFVALIALVAGCSKQDYSDPKAFLDQYGQELVAKDFGKEEMSILGIERFVFTDEKVGIDKYKDEFVSAWLSVVPKRGMKYHQIAKPTLKWVDCSLPNDNERKYIDANTYDDLKKAGRDLNDGLFCPRMYNPEPFDERKAFNRFCLVRIYRAKDSSGILRPLSGGKTLKCYSNENDISEITSGLPVSFSSRNIATEEYIRSNRMIACRVGDNLSEKFSEYNAHVINMTNAYAQITRAVNTLKELDGTGKPGENGKRWEEEKVEKSVDDLRRLIRCLNETLAYEKKVAEEHPSKESEARVLETKKRLERAKETYKKDLEFQIEKWSREYGMRRSDAEHTLKKAIKTIYDEVDAMNAAIGKGKGKSTFKWWR